MAVAVIVQQSNIPRQVNSHQFYAENNDNDRVFMR